MLRLEFGGDDPLRLLVIGAHSDDIEIGCGGTLLSLLGSRPTTVYWIVFSAEGHREAEARQSAAAFLRDAVEHTVEVLDFRDGFFPFEGAAVKEHFERLKGDVSPDLVFTHHLADRHQDHRLLAELTWNTFRDHAILEYEVVKYDGDLGKPNVFVPLDSRHSRRKVEMLMTLFGSQRSQRWFSEDTFTAMMRLRGVEAGLAHGHAEAFYGRKLTLQT